MNLSPLDPTLDSARFEAIVSAIVSDAARARAARPAGEVMLLELVRWTRPLLAAAAAIALVASAALFGHRAPPAGAESLAQLVGIPPVVTAWAEAGGTPPVTELARLTGRDHER